jgi:hypothetical protein|tara:strand:+ start:2550 stop:2741 length:192 start_codon:yes stop_codon:yes gene_type:complete
MPEYQATIKNNVKGVNSRKIKLLASCYSDAEKDVNKSLRKDEYLHSLDSINFPKDKFNIVERR